MANRLSGRFACGLVVGWVGRIRDALQSAGELKQPHIPGGDVCGVVGCDVL